VPHLILEHSKGLTERIDMTSLVEKLHACAVEMPALPTGGIRTRAYEADLSRVADGAPDRHFIYLTVRLGQGRSEPIRREIGDRLFAVLTDFTQAHFDAGHPLSLGLEIQEIEKDWTWKKNNIHAILKGDDNG
jgi:5-carboxymethyl-2-hydroxymuconate isomerase